MADGRPKTAVALGFFDGLHLGHMGVLSPVLEKKKDGLTPVVLLFDRHPRAVITGRSVDFLLENDERDRILTGMGFMLNTLAFSRVRDMSADVFFREIVIGELNAGFVSCGFNYSFGAKGSGKTEDLTRLCRENGVDCRVCPEITVGNKTVSSSAIRGALAAGDILSANEMLGRPFGFTSPVFSGDHRGRLLGSPTINQYLPEGLAVPKFGVYAAYVYVDGVKYAGVTNIGCRPTFDGTSVRSETFILDFSGDLYGRRIKTELLEFIRPEKKFSSAGELALAIRGDARYVGDRYKIN